MIKAVIFDCFGVLAGDGWLPFKRKYFAHNQALFDQATDLNKQVDGGFITFDDFIAGIAELAHITKAAAYDEIERNPVYEALFEYIKTELKPNYKLGMLSNAGANFLPQLFSAEQIALFDGVALSFETGYSKPDERAYRLIAEQLAVEPSECVFIDDQERFVTAARDIGMQAVHFQNFEQARGELEQILAK